MAQAPNLTRDQARERSATITTSSYDIAIDLTDGSGGPSEKTYRTRATITFTATPGARSFIDFVGDGLAGAELNGRQLDVGGWTSTDGLVLDELAAENELVIDAVGLYTNTGEGLHRFVEGSTAPSTSIRSSRRPTPNGSTRVSTSPTSRRGSPSPSPRRRTGTSSPMGR